MPINEPEQMTSYLLSNGCVRDSIWTFSKEKQARYSSMTRDNFLGFGCSATTLLKEQFKINTFDVKEYCQRINSQELATSLTTWFSLRQRMIYYLFWMAYSMRINAQEFERFFGVPLQKIWNDAGKAFEVCQENQWGIWTDPKRCFLLSLLRELLHPFLYR